MCLSVSWLRCLRSKRKRLSVSYTPYTISFLDNPVYKSICGAEMGALFLSLSYRSFNVERKTEPSDSHLFMVVCVFRTFVHHPFKQYRPGIVRFLSFLIVRVSLSPFLFFFFTCLFVHSRHSSARESGPFRLSKLSIRFGDDVHRMICIRAIMSNGSHTNPFIKFVTARQPTWT